MKCQILTIDGEKMAVRVELRQSYFILDVRQLSYTASWYTILFHLNPTRNDVSFCIFTAPKNATSQLRKQKFRNGVETLRVTFSLKISDKQQHGDEIKLRMDDFSFKLSC
jgi:hypothetical protein